MRRREFVAALGSLAMCWPKRAQAQSGSATVGCLAAPAEANYTHHVAAIREGLKEFGFIEGQNLKIEFRWAEGRYERLPAMASDLVQRKVDVIITMGGGPPVRAAKEATTSIPIVFHLGADPVQLGLVKSLNRPGGNITGITLMTNSLEPKRLELLSKMVPSAKSVAVLANPFNQSNAQQVNQVRDAARAAQLEIAAFNSSTLQELEAEFARMVSAKVDGLIVLSDVFFTSNSPRIAALAQLHRIPAIAHSREFAEAGGLMSYGTNLEEAYRLVGNHAGRILKGESPAGLPVIEPTRFDFVINTKSAGLLGISVPPLLLAISDEVIE